jgi:hypothetical protein
MPPRGRAWAFEPPLLVLAFEVSSYLHQRETLATPQATGLMLEAGCRLVSHHPPRPPYDSILDQAFASAGLTCRRLGGWSGRPI